jgi:hypothetical protein
MAILRFRYDGDRPSFSGAYGSEDKIIGSFNRRHFTFPVVEYIGPRIFRCECGKHLPDGLPLVAVQSTHKDAGMKGHYPIWIFVATKQSDSDAMAILEKGF